MTDEVTLAVLRLIESGKATVGEAERLLGSLGKLADAPTPEAPAIPCVPLPPMLALTGPASVRRQARWTPEEDALLTEEIGKGSAALGLVAIAEALNRTPGSIYARMYDLGLPLRKGDFSAVRAWHEQDKKAKKAAHG